MDITGIILCGGRSKRMGTDKALLKLGDETFLSRVIQTITPFCNSVVISGNNADYSSYGLTVIEDELPDSGALGGLYSALNSSQTDWNLVLTCDAPLVDSEIIEKLRSAVDEQQKVVHAITEKDGHPLIGFYHKSCAEVFRSAINVGSLKLQPAVNKCDPLKVLFKDEGSEKLQNINTPEDYQSLLNRYG